MPRKSTGSVIEKPTRHGVSYALRFRALGRRQYLTLGTEADGWTEERAEAELAYTLEQVRRGEWEPPAEAEHDAPREVPTFHVFASEWMADRRPELRPSTVATYTWELTEHLLPHFAGKRLDEITVEDVDTYRRRKVAERRLGPTSINKTITRLGQILDVAQERGWIVQNPVRVNPRNRKVRAARPNRPWLEPVQVEALLEAAAELDRADRRSLPTRRPLLATLAYAGLRIGEACDLRWRCVDLAGGTIRVEASKTEAGERDVDIQPELREDLIAWRSRTPYAAPDDRVFVTASGGPLNRHSVRQRVVLRTAEVASEALERAGREPLPAGLSPHALRRSFASWLIAEGEDVAYVMAQLGHVDPTMTLGVYARAVRTRRESARSRRRVEAFRAPTGTEALPAAHETIGAAVS